MTLEDFFTLTEMKDGLTAPDRIKELVNVMQKEKDFTVKNAGDATRQWSTVASTIAATEDKDCLDLFIQLDGLWFIDKWIKDAQKFINDTSDSFVEESITALLRALESLKIDYEKSTSYGLQMTVKDLLGHSNPKVQGRARILFDSWKQDDDSNAVSHNFEKIGASHADEIGGSADLAEQDRHPEYSAQNISLSGVGASERKHVEVVEDQMMPSICSDVVQPEWVDDVQTQTCSKEGTLDHEVIENESSMDPAGTSIMLEPVKDDLYFKEVSPAVVVLVDHSEGIGSVETCTSVVQLLNQGTEAKSDVPESDDSIDKAKQMHEVTSCLNKSGETGMSSVASQVEPKYVPSAIAANAQESAMDPDLHYKFDTKNKDSATDSPIHDMRMDISDGKGGINDTGSPDHSRTVMLFRNNVHDSNTNLPMDSSGSEGKFQKAEDPEGSFSTEDRGATDRSEEHDNDQSEDLTDDTYLFEPAVDSIDPVVFDKRSSDLEFDYCMVDALEVARQVAIEVEREVVNYREPSCSSSEKISEGVMRQPESQESIRCKQIRLIEASSKEVPTGPNLSSKEEEELSNVLKDLDADVENCIQDIECSDKFSEAVQEPKVNTEEGLGDFDLNQEVCSEDVDHPANSISTPISMVSASWAAAASGLPAAPLRFEGAHGWKGSAATSAFRAASPRRNFDGDKFLVNEGTHNSSKQQQDCLGFDLNVAEAGDDKFGDLVPGKQLPVFSGLPSGESSVEARPSVSERLKFDLNHISDDGDAPSDWRMDGWLHHRNSHYSGSPSSSSSSMQPSLRNLDLNDQPSFYNGSSDLQPYLGKSSLHNLNASRGLKPEDSGVSIFGFRMEVNRKEFVPQIRSVPNGRILESALDMNLASGGVFGMGSAVPYAQPPLFGYNDLPTGGPAVSFPPAMYRPSGPIPCMVDSRGAPVVPQIVGSASASPAAYFQPPFRMSMIGTPPGANGFGLSRANFDLNSGLMLEAGNRDSGGFGQFLYSGQSTTVDEQLRANLLPSSSTGAAGKRKEPDGGWEPYPFNLKHHQPPWK